jgi:hypothetical protein
MGSPREADINLLVLPSKTYFIVCDKYDFREDIEKFGLTREAIFLLFSFFLVFFVCVAKIVVIFYDSVLSGHLW